jgi:hypothetical protein
LALAEDDYIEAQVITTAEDAPMVCSARRATQLAAWAVT